METKNMAISNAFGSNTFNIMIGLGLPWLVYTSFNPYHGLKDEGITLNVIMLGSVLLVFVINVIASGFVLYRWHAILYVSLYVAYIGYNIYLVYA
jgi:Ca2+/Na+ antiporter